MLVSSEDSCCDSVNIINAMCWMRYVLDKICVGENCVGKNYNADETGGRRIP
jgi:hypothetical protein